MEYEINIQKPVVQDNLMGQRIVFSTNGCGTSGNLHAKNEAGPPHTINKNDLKVDERPKCKPKKRLLEHIGEHFCDLELGNSFQIGCPKHKSHQTSSTPLQLAICASWTPSGE